ncbi:hypothetical protein BDV26DRAFT_276855 [Aspergillus bertholletiae]|uniref:Uncharacterized protein n=1 Tax=Aspergillus bertholletiae TaxID=1226010 RepID=A0A5N7APW6_9EURO|nr:hypothetical protein BDV26DRAFT_276855 [Aspergillus bertholletiae]
MKINIRSQTNHCKIHHLGACGLAMFLPLTTFSRISLSTRAYIFFLSYDFISYALLCICFFSSLEAMIIGYRWPEMQPLHPPLSPRPLYEVTLGFAPHPAHT